MDETNESWPFIPSISSNGNNSISSLTTVQSTGPVPPPTVRERNRMHALNEAFDELRRVVPKANLHDHQRLSKIATLRLAIHYISCLTQILDAHGNLQTHPRQLLSPTTELQTMPMSYTNSDTFNLTRRQGTRLRRRIRRTTPDEHIFDESI